ncbi:hypothetical protein BFP70_16415 [Thioclava sp. SK-1]|uniref:hypothetical protein n=1 Tax=Thioclava sp. SK-1 TaxID=1889770 RepID=UPI0008252604|nr:hypothetical protein [Thioclava sp. SK-1]OCX61038.1 hypothetical protein BFP70_16415 [Thioclava sp. SK-1]
MAVCFALVAGGTVASAGSEPIEFAQERECLAVVVGYTEWLERVDMMNLSGAESGFYGNPIQEIARIENARYAILTRLIHVSGRTDVSEFALARDEVWAARLATPSPSSFQELGSELRLALKPCLGELMAQN